MLSNTFGQRQDLMIKLVAQMLGSGLCDWNAIGLFASLQESEMFSFITSCHVGYYAYNA